MSQKINFAFEKNAQEGSDHYTAKTKILDFFEVEIGFVHEPKDYKPQTGDPYSVLGSLVVHVGKGYKPFQCKVYKNKSQSTGGVYYASSKFGTNGEMKVFVSKEASTADRFASMVAKRDGVEDKELGFTGTLVVEDSLIDELKRLKESFAETDEIQPF